MWILISDAPTLEYWKELADQRRIALEEALKENERLVLRVEVLESDNKSLEEMLEDAKTLAEMINVRGCWNSISRFIRLA